MDFFQQALDFQDPSISGCYLEENSAWPGNDIEGGQFEDVKAPNICREKCKTLNAPFFTWRGPASGVSEAKINRCYCKSAKRKNPKRQPGVYSGLTADCCPFHFHVVNKTVRALYAHLEVQCPDGSCHRVRPTTPSTEEAMVDACEEIENVCGGGEPMSRAEKEAICSKRCPEYKVAGSSKKIMHHCGEGPTLWSGRCLGSFAICDGLANCADGSDENDEACGYSNYW